MARRASPGKKPRSRALGFSGDIVPIDLTRLGAGILEGLMDFLLKKYPWYPPCPNAIMTSAQSGWGCYEGHICFVDTVTWRCPDGTTITKKGPAITTDQKC